MSDETPLIGDRNYLFLDEALDKGVMKDTGAAYPPLTVEERRVLKVVANGLFLSESSVQWSFYNAQRGQKDAWRRVLAILAGKSVKLVTGS